MKNQTLLPTPDLFSGNQIEIKRMIYKIQSELSFDYHVRDTASNGFEIIAEMVIKRKIELHNKLVKKLMPFANKC